MTARSGGRLQSKVLGALFSALQISANFAMDPCKSKFHTLTKHQRKLLPLYSLFFFPIFAFTSLSLAHRQTQTNFVRRCLRPPSAAFVIKLIPRPAEARQSLQPSVTLERPRVDRGNYFLLPNKTKKNFDSLRPRSSIRCGQVRPGQA